MGTVFALAWVIVACSGGSSSPSTDVGARMERLSVKDEAGFARPMEAYSLLVPDGWTSQGGITWLTDTTCQAEAIHNRLTVSSPDGAWVLDIYPDQQWTWNDDPLARQLLADKARDPVARGCPVGDVTDLGELVKGVMAKEIGAEVTAVESHDAELKLLTQLADESAKHFKARGFDVTQQPSAVLATLRYPDGTPGLAAATLIVTRTRMANALTGGTNTATMTLASRKVALRFPAGQEVPARALLDTILASIQVHPQWQSAVTRRTAKKPPADAPTPD